MPPRGVETRPVGCEREHCRPWKNGLPDTRLLPMSHHRTWSSTTKVPPMVRKLGRAVGLPAFNSSNDRSMVVRNNRQYFSGCSGLLGPPHFFASCSLPLWWFLPRWLNTLKFEKGASYTISRALTRGAVLEVSRLCSIGVAVKPRQIRQPKLNSRTVCSAQLLSPKWKHVRALLSRKGCVLTGFWSCAMEWI